MRTDTTDMVSRYSQRRLWPLRNYELIAHCSECDSPLVVPSFLFS